MFSEAPQRTSCREDDSGNTSRNTTGMVVRRRRNFASSYQTNPSHNSRQPLPPSRRKTPIKRRNRCSTAGEERRITARSSSWFVVCFYLYSPKKILTSPILTQIHQNAILRTFCTKSSQSISRELLRFLLEYCIFFI